MGLVKENIQPQEAVACNESFTGWVLRHGCMWESLKEGVCPEATVQVIHHPEGEEGKGSSKGEGSQRVAYVSRSCCSAEWQGISGRRGLKGQPE